MITTILLTIFFTGTLFILALASVPPRLSRHGTRRRHHNEQMIAGSDLNQHFTQMTGQAGSPHILRHPQIISPAIDVFEGW